MGATKEREQSPTFSDLGMHCSDKESLSTSETVLFFSEKLSNLIGEYTLRACDCKCGREKPLNLIIILIVLDRPALPRELGIRN